LQGEDELGERGKEAADGWVGAKGEEVEGDEEELVAGAEDEERELRWGD
jgi:hypothetical protein